MDKNKKLTLALFILIGISVFVWIPNFKSFNSKKQVSFLNDSLDKRKFVSFLPVLQKEKMFQYNYIDWGKNPFLLEEHLVIKKEKEAISVKKDLTEEDLAKGFILEGIFWNEERPSALINNQLLQKGTKINGNTVLKITPEQVILNNGTNDFTLKMR